MRIRATLHTDGSGYWSDECRAVDVVNIDIGYLDNVGEFGEMRVFFNPDTWDVIEHGLIYTDDMFERELRSLLQSVGFTAEEAENVSYSEQGMQGDDYVSLDMGERACAAWRRLCYDEFQMAMEWNNAPY